MSNLTKRNSSSPPAENVVENPLHSLEAAADQERKELNLKNVELPRKRRRIAIACSSCRYRKSRCDGARPKCSTCVELGYDCVYAQSGQTDKTVVPKAYLESLEARLGMVEDILEALRAGLDGRRNTRGITGEAHNTSHGESEDESNTALTQGPTDGMGAIIFAREENPFFFGPSSNIAFTHHISEAVNASLRKQPANTSSLFGETILDSRILHVTRPPSPSNLNPDGSKEEDMDPQALFNLPSDEETLRLIQSYFANTGVLFPYIHEETFFKTYKEVRSTGFRNKHCWLGMLNVILAMSTSASIGGTLSAEKRAARSNVFFSRAVTLCTNRIRRGASLEIVQCLLLMGQYLQGTNRSLNAWIIHGHAVKAAYQLGLHSKNALGKFRPLDREIRTRTWYGCIILDRILSMTFGRPPAIPDNHIKLELPRDYGDLDLDQPLDTQRAISSTNESLLFFNATITLYDVMYKVVDSLYGGNLGCESISDKSDIISSLRLTEQQLHEWQEDLPSILSLVQPDELPKEIQQQANNVLRFRIILSLRYHNLRILAHRPVLVKFLDLLSDDSFTDNELSVLQQDGIEIMQTCVQSAVTIVNIVSYAVHATGVQRPLLGAWWFSLYYTFNAALVIFSSLLICFSEKSYSVQFPFLNLEVYMKDLQRAVESILLLDIGNRMVETCAKYVSRLIQILEALQCAHNERVERSDTTSTSDTQDTMQTYEEIRPPFNLYSPCGTNDFLVLGELDFLDPSYPDLYP